MQVKSIENTDQRVKFKSSADMQMASSFVNMNDDQLKDLAYISAVNRDDNKKRRRSVLALFYAMPVVDSITSGILPTVLTPTNKILKIKNASLGKRTALASKTAGKWALILATVGIYNSAKKAIVSDSKGSQNFGQKHPVLSFIIDIGIILGGLALANKGIQKLVNKPSVQNSKFMQNLKLKSIQAKHWLDNTKFNKEVLPILSEGASKLSEKLPRVSKVTKGLIANSVLVVFVAGLIKMFRHSNKENKKIEKNYNELKDAQLKTAKHLTNALAVERDILAKEKHELKTELRHEKHKQHHPEPEDDEKIIDK